MITIRSVAIQFGIFSAGFALLFAAFLKHEFLYRPGSVGYFLVGFAAGAGIFLVHEAFHFRRYQNQE